MDAADVVLRNKPKLNVVLDATMPQTFHVCSNEEAFFQNKLDIPN